jgi:hypothetical protein
VGAGRAEAGPAGLDYIACHMAKEKTQYTCNECGGSSPKWLGKCPHCNAWNTLIESVTESTAPAKNRFASLAKTAEVTTLADIDATDVQRTPTGHDELDRVLGGGIVAATRASASPRCCCRRWIRCSAPGRRRST